MQEKTQKYIKEKLNILEIYINTIQSITSETAKDAHKELRDLKKLYKKFPSK